MIIPKLWTLESLPEKDREKLLQQRVVKDNKTYRSSSSLKKTVDNMGSLFADLESDEDTGIDTVVSKVIWGTDNYENIDKEHSFNYPIKDVTLIKPRVEKSKAEQKKRVKEKAEVFTPNWVCNKMNNLVDDAWFGVDEKDSPFNVIDTSDDTKWRVQDKVVFPDNRNWVEYAMDRRIEFCCGEGPYLFASYDATIGDYIPLRNDDGVLQRIGLLDRKLRVITENAEDLEVWELVVEKALQNTFGFEWQGDNLLLARLNMVNTYFDYWFDYIKINNLKKPSKKVISDRLNRVCEIASEQLIQMDGLKFVTPESCSDECKSCKKKLKKDHDGILPVFSWGNTYKTFEDLLNKS